MTRQKRMKMAIAKFEAERFGSNGQFYNIRLDGHDIGKFVRGFEIKEHMDGPSIVVLEIVAHAFISEAVDEDV